MEEHDGSITVDSGLGAGANFKLSLPIYNPE
jgi:signal transduction histidine kinase